METVRSLQDAGLAVFFTIDAGPQLKAVCLAESAESVRAALDNTDGYAHASLAYVSYNAGDFDRAMHEARVALDLNPNHVNIIMTMGWISVVCGEPEAGIQFIESKIRKISIPEVAACSIKETIKLSG